MTDPGAGARAEAHLWLLLEEALVAARQGDVGVWEVQRGFRHVCDALLAAGVASPSVTTALRYELDDALVVRGLLPPASFTGWAALGVDVIREEETTADGSVWLEAELERHLDLLAGYDPNTASAAGADTMRILAGPVRALESAGALGAGKAMVADFVASISAAGFDIGQVDLGLEGGRVRREWVRYLRDRPAPWGDGEAMDDVRHPQLVLGTIGERMVRVDGVAWSDRELVVHLTVRSVGRGWLDTKDTVGWSLRVLDDRGRLHLGQPVPPVSGLRYRLRPGLVAGVRRLDVRLTARGERLEGSIPL